MSVETIPLLGNRQLDDFDPECTSNEHAGPLRAKWWAKGPCGHVYLRCDRCRILDLRRLSLGWRGRCSICETVFELDELAWGRL